MAFLQQNPLAVLGLMLTLGYLGGLAANRLGLPRITGYITAGLLLSPSLFGLLGTHQVAELLHFVSAFALAIIAFVTGASLRVSQVRLVGGQILWITIAEGLGAFVFVSLAVLLAGLLVPTLREHGTETYIRAMLLMGSISLATAPAAVLAVVHELRAKGTFTTVLLGVVALDDALTIIISSLVISLVGQMTSMGAGLHFGLAAGIWEIAGSLLVGGAGGILLPLLVKVRRRAHIELVITLGLVFLVAGVSKIIGASPLLASMVMGFVTVNTYKQSDELFTQLENLEEALYCLFFALAGAHFNLSVLDTSALLGGIMLLGRFTGKLTGSYLGATFSGAPARVGKILGFSLFPQAGLSLGLIFLTKPLLPAEVYGVLLNGMLALVIFNEILAPPLLKWSLVRSGETHPE